MTTAVAERTAVSMEIQEKVLISGDLSKLTPSERLSYYKRLCESIGVNPLSRPFEYIVLNDKLTLYAKKDCTDQLREQRDIDVEIKSREVIDDVFVVTAKAKMNTGRQDESIGAVSLVKEDGEWKTAQSGKRYFSGNGNYKRLPPDDRANAMMKAETKAKRRVTLSICGLGVVDESELDTIRDKKKVLVDDTGEILHETASPPAPPAEIVEPDATETLFTDSQAVADYEIKLQDAKGKPADLQAVWDEIVKDQSLKQPERAKLYQIYQKVGKKK